MSSTPVIYIRRLFTNFIYSIINENSKFIEPVSNSKFTDFDIFHQIETAESLSDLQRYLFSSLNHFIEEIVQSSTDNADYIIESALDYIRRNYNDCITLSDTATHVYLNKNYFSTLFKSKVGITYREYLRDYRVKEAIRLILNSDMKVYEIAQAVGYNDSAHFIRAFKEVTGKSPSAYK